MSVALYNPDILRLAAEMPHGARLPAPMGSSEKRSAVCGSRVTVDVDLDADGRVAAVGMLVRACALGQAASSLLAGGAVGRTPSELAEARDDLARWLTQGGAAPDWPGLGVFEPARAYPARHASIRLAFEAAAEAAEQASAKAAAA
ncbi:iron-sulfur cluster assembly scaffold protein [uncultured Sphingomonas sp.]|uniref:iron-sulfur cluster assembly scaffold protein n=1 Tax=uncultured Sphingomonas sp. TaxID=158754 RepID=UPI0035CBFDDD